MKAKLTILYRQANTPKKNTFTPCVELRKWYRQTRDGRSFQIEYVLESQMLTPWEETDGVSTRILECVHDWQAIREAILSYDNLLPTAKAMTEHYLAEPEQGSDEIPY
jgi:hypothetical protein